MDGLTSSAKRPKPDAAANFCDYRARYYDQLVGRFLREDPIGFEGGIDFYAYVHNTPTTLADPFGLLKIDPSCNCSGGWNANALPLAGQLASAGAGRITDINLRDCILRKLGGNGDGPGVVKCGGKKCDKGQQQDAQGKILAGWAPPFGNTIHLCKGAQGGAPGGAPGTKGSDLSVACTMVHEFAHTCGHPFEGKPNQAANQAFQGLCPQ